MQNLKRSFIACGFILSKTFSFHFPAKMRDFRKYVLFHKQHFENIILIALYKISKQMGILNV